MVQRTGGNWQRTAGLLHRASRRNLIPEKSAYGPSRCNEGSYRSTETPFKLLPETESRIRIHVEVSSTTWGEETISQWP